MRERLSQPPIVCFLPLTGLFGGAFLGWTLAVLMPNGDLFHDVSKRGLMFLFGLFGWCLQKTVAEGKRLHCGGTEDLTDQSDRRYGFLLLFFSAMLLVVAAVLLGLDKLVFYWILSVAVVGILAGEIGWRRPLFIFVS